MQEASTSIKDATPADKQSHLALILSGNGQQIRMAGSHHSHSHTHAHGNSHSHHFDMALGRKIAASHTL